MRYRAKLNLGAEAGWGAREPPTPLRALELHPIGLRQRGFLARSGGGDDPDAPGAVNGVTPQDEPSCRNGKASAAAAS